MNKVEVTRGRPGVSLGNFTPPTDNEYDLGTAALSWRNIYVDTLIYVTGMVMQGDFIPSTDGTYDLGENSTPLEWQDLHLDGIAYIDTLYVEVAGRVNNDIIFALGTDSDIAAVLRSTTLNADTNLTGVLVGGSQDTSALAANSLIISNVTTDGDILVAVSDGGHSKQMLFLDGSTGITHIGKPGTSTVVNASGDVYMSSRLEVAGNIEGRGTHIKAHDDVRYAYGLGGDFFSLYETADTDARVVLNLCYEAGDSGDNVPAWVFAELTNINNVDLGLLDEVVQPHIVAVENTGVVKSSSSATSDDGGATVEFLDTGVGTASQIGDVLRVTAGTNATVGWYWITTVVGADEVDLDRNWCTGDVSGGTYKIFRGIGMITPRAFYLPIYDGAPDDNDIDIDMAGAMALDVGQANGRLYWRVGAAWHYVDATAGLSLPKEERVDVNGHEFQLGDTVELVVDRINDDGSFHAMPVYGGV